MKKIIGANKIIVIDEAQSINDIGKKLKILQLNSLLTAI